MLSLDTADRGFSAKLPHAPKPTLGAETSTRECDPPLAGRHPAPREIDRLAPARPYPVSLSFSLSPSLRAGGAVALWDFPEAVAAGHVFTTNQSGLCLCPFPATFFRPCAVGGLLSLFKSLPLCASPFFWAGQTGGLFWTLPERRRPNASCYRCRQRKKNAPPFAPRHFHFVPSEQPLSLFFLSDLLPLSSLLLGGANAEFLGLSRGAQFDSESQSTSMEEIEIVLFLFGKLRLIVDQQSGRRHFQRNFAFPFHNFGFRIVRRPHIVGYVAAREFQNNFGVPRDWCRMNVFSLYMVCGARKRDRKR